MKRLSVAEMSSNQHSLAAFVARREWGLAAACCRTHRQFAGIRERIGGRDGKGYVG
jgi:hypothetical protein